MKLVAVCSFLALAGAGAYCIHRWGREALGLGKNLRGALHDAPLFT